MVDRPKEREYISVAGLKSRGWTDSLIRRFLGKEDKSVENPHYSSAPMMRLYSFKRVLAVESEENFEEAKGISYSRSIRGREIARVRSRKLIEQARNMEVKIRILSKKELFSRSIESYNDFHGAISLERGGWEWEPAAYSSSREFLDRIRVNYVRHELTDYDEELENVAGKVGVREAVEVIQEKIFDKISEAYPYLSNECKKQKLGKLSDTPLCRSAP